MAHLPIKEAEILRPARKMIAGFNRRPQDFPAPLVPVEQGERELADAEEDLKASLLADAAASSGS